MFFNEIDCNDFIKSVNGPIEFLFLHGEGNTHTYIYFYFFFRSVSLWFFRSFFFVNTRALFLIRCLYSVAVRSPRTPRTAHFIGRIVFPIDFTRRRRRQRPPRKRHISAVRRIRPMGPRGAIRLRELNRRAYIVSSMAAIIINGMGRLPHRATLPVRRAATGTR